MNEEIFKKIQRVEIRARHVVTSAFSGEYHAVFKGQGISFSEIREYQPGDDIRLIDWNVTAKTGTPYIKVFDEERELTVLLLVDISDSTRFGSMGTQKRDVMIEIAAVLGFSASQNQDKVGLLLCTSKLEKRIAPKRGRNHILRLIRELYCTSATESGTDLSVGLSSLLRLQKRKAIVFVISDFWDTRLYKTLKQVSGRHEVIPIVVTDPREHTLPDSGILWLEDAETGQNFPVDTSRPEVRQRYAAQAAKHHADRDRFFKQHNLVPIPIDTTQPYVTRLRHYFASRSHRHV